MASSMKFALGKAFVLSLCVSPCTGGLLPKYRMLNSTVALGNTSSQQVLGLGVPNARSPTEYWCFDMEDLSSMKCCGLGDNECNHAAVCYDQVDCQDGCELDRPIGIDSGTTLFTWYVFGFSTLCEKGSYEADD